MRKYVFLFFLASFFVNGLNAQCESCNPPEGIVSHHCYQDGTQPGKCAMFTKDQGSFYFEDANRKKKQVVEVQLPANMGTPSISYLSHLAEDKALRLTTEDVLFIRDAIHNWLHVEAIRNWNADLNSQGFTITPSGLAYKVLNEGQGASPETGQKVKVHYTGYFTDGKKFDSSRDRMQPFVFPLGKGRVIKGWDEGVAMMRPGARYLFRLPPDLAYGERGAGGTIPPNSVLYFDVAFLSVEK